MRALLACLLLLSLAACMERRLPEQEAREIRSLVLVVETFDEISVTTHWTDLQRSREVYNPRTKRMETEFLSKEVRQSGTKGIRADPGLRAELRGVLERALSVRYRIDPSDRRMPAIQEPFNPIGVAVKGRAGSIADAVEAAIPAGIADAVLVVRGPIGSMDYDYGRTPGRRDASAAGRVQASYDLYLIDGRTFGVIGAVGPGLRPDRRDPAAAPRIPAVAFLSMPHAYRLASQEYDEKNLTAYVETLRKVIESDVPQQVRHLGLLAGASDG